MAWSIEGRYFENCSCEVVCPCTASLALGADYDYCRVALVFHIDSGEVDGVDVSGLTVVPVAEPSKYMCEGIQRLRLMTVPEIAATPSGTRVGECTRRHR